MSYNQFQALENKPQQVDILRLVLNSQQKINHTVQNQAIQNERQYCLISNKLMKIPVKTKNCTRHAAQYDLVYLINELYSEEEDEDIQCTDHYEERIECDQIINKNNITQIGYLQIDSNLYLKMIQSPEFYAYHNFSVDMDNFLKNEKYDIFKDVFLNTNSILIPLLNFCSSVYYNKQHNKQYYDNFQQQVLSQIPKEQKLITYEHLQINGRDIKQQIEIPVRCFQCKTIQVRDLRTVAVALYKDLQQQLIPKCIICQSDLLKLLGQNSRREQYNLDQYINNFYIDIKILVEVLNDKENNQSKNLEFFYNKDEEIYEHIQQEQDLKDLILSKNQIDFFHYQYEKYFVQLTRISTIPNDQRKLVLPVCSDKCIHENISCYELDDYIQMRYQYGGDFKCLYKNCTNILRLEDMKINGVVQKILEEHSKLPNNQQNIVNYDMQQRHIVVIDKQKIMQQQSLKNLKRKQDELMQKKKELLSQIREQLQKKADENNKKFSDSGITQAKIKVTDKQVQAQYEKLQGINKSRVQEERSKYATNSQKGAYMQSIDKEKQQVAERISSIPGVVLKSHIKKKQDGIVLSNKDGSILFEEKMKAKKVENQIAQNEKNLAQINEIMKHYEIEQKKIQKFVNNPYNDRNNNNNQNIGNWFDDNQDKQDPTANQLFQDSQLSMKSDSMDVKIYQATKEMGLDEQIQLDYEKEVQMQQMQFEQANKHRLFQETQDIEQRNQLQNQIKARENGLNSIQNQQNNQNFQQFQQPQQIQQQFQQQQYQQNNFQNQQQINLQYQQQQQFQQQQTCYQQQQQLPYQIQQQTCVPAQQQQQQLPYQIQEQTCVPGQQQQQQFPFQNQEQTCVPGQQQQQIPFQNQEQTCVPQQINYQQNMQQEQSEIQQLSYQYSQNKEPQQQTQNNILSNNQGNQQIQSGVLIEEEENTGVQNVYPSQPMQQNQLSNSSINNSQNIQQQPQKIQQNNFIIQEDENQQPQDINQNQNNNLPNIGILNDNTNDCPTEVDIIRPRQRKKKQFKQIDLSNQED